MMHEGGGKLNLTHRFRAKKFQVKHSYLKGSLTFLKLQI